MTDLTANEYRCDVCGSKTHDTIVHDSLPVVVQHEQYGPCIHRPPSPGQSMCSCKHQAIERDVVVPAIVERAQREPQPSETALRQIEERIERLEDVAERWDWPGGSRRLAQRARDKAEGLRVARRLFAAQPSGAPSGCTCGRAWEGHPNPHAITCPEHAHAAQPSVPAPSTVSEILDLAADPNTPDAAIGRAVRGLLARHAALAHDQEASR